MEEKKVCTCCENKEPELEELQDEEMQEIAGGSTPPTRLPKALRDSWSNK